jgi:HPt (histidine-containing phosphotransfer) domain-containing protein
LTNAVEVDALEQLYQELGSDPEPIRDLIESYLKEAPAALARLRSAIERGSGADLATAAHSLKSSSAMLGAKQVAALAVELERIGRSGRLTGAAERFATMSQQFPRVEQELRSWMPR